MRNCVIQQENSCETSCLGLLHLLQRIISAGLNQGYRSTAGLNLEFLCQLRTWLLSLKLSPSFPEVSAEMRSQFQGHHWLLSKWAIAQHCNSCQGLPRRGTWFSCVSVSLRSVGSWPAVSMETVPAWMEDLHSPPWYFWMWESQFNSKLNFLHCPPAMALVVSSRADLMAFARRGEKIKILQVECIWECPQNCMHIIST